MLTKVEDPSEETIVGAVQCLQVLALDLGVTAEHTKLVQDMLLHFVHKPAGQCCMDHHLNLNIHLQPASVRFAGSFSYHKMLENHGVW